MLRFFISLFSLSFFLVSCNSDSFKPDDHLSLLEQDAFKWKVVRYIGRSPEGISVAERFYPQYDTHYREQQSIHVLEAYFEQKDTIYFMMSRKAPSLVEKRVATGGKLILKNDQIEFYQEVFRTWKMVPDTLKKRSMFLFEKMVKGESLEPFLTKNSAGVEYIEFPDDRTWFDSRERVWKLR